MRSIIDKSEPKLLEKKILLGNLDITFLSRENDQLEENIFELIDEV